jgi:hypothetical protein
MSRRTDGPHREGRPRAGYHHAAPLTPERAARRAAAEAEAQLIRTMMQAQRGPALLVEVKTAEKPGE